MSTVRWTLVVAVVLVAGPAAAQSEVYFPGQATFATITYEDLWPQQGDYDFNDVTLRWHTRRAEDASGDVTALQYDFVPWALGASQCNGLALRLPVDPGGLTVHRAIGVDPDGTAWTVAVGAAVDDGAGGSVIAISADLRSELCGVSGFLNTVPGAPGVACDPLGVLITFATPSDTLSATPGALDPGDLFLTRCGAVGHQTHLSRYPGVPGGPFAADTSRFGTGDDASDVLTDGTPDPFGTRWYVDTGAMPWGLVLGDDVADGVPAEYTRIDALYGDLPAWVLGSGGCPGPGCFWHATQWTPGGSAYTFTPGDEPPLVIWNTACEAGDAGAPDCDGVCDVDDAPDGIDCDEACDFHDALPGPDCDGVCDDGDELYGPDCGGDCLAGDSPTGPNCDGACDYFDALPGPDCDFVCDAADELYGPDCDGDCHPGDARPGPNCDGECDYFDELPGPDCDAVCDVGDEPWGPDCDGACHPGDAQPGPNCDGACDFADDLPSPDCDGACGAGDAQPGPDCDFVCDAADLSGGPDCDAVCDPADAPDGPDCDEVCDPGEEGTSDCFCGDGVVDATEGCDSGPANGSDGVCSTACTPAASSLVTRANGACAVVSGQTRCWGDNSQLTTGDTASDSHVPYTQSTLTGVSQVAYGIHFSCARIGGTVKCWGSENGTYGTFGTGSNSPASSRTPQADVSGVTTATQLTVGDNHACVLLANQTVKCWGDNGLGQLGTGSRTPVNNPTPVTVTGVSGAVQVVANDHHTCARLSGGTIKCWGRNNSGQLGKGSASSACGGGGDTCEATPVTVSGITDATHIAVGHDFACALRSGAVRVSCWGDNGSGALGTGSATPTSTLGPVAATALPAGVVELSLGYEHGCLRTSADEVQCWGNRVYGRIGDGADTPNALTPSVVTLPAASGIAAGFYHTCATLRDGTVRCWGRDDQGQQGNGATLTANQLVPGLVSGF